MNPTDQPNAEPQGDSNAPVLAPRHRRRSLLRAAGVVCAAALLWLVWSVGGALTAPGTDGIDARLAEWARSNNLGFVVDALERVQYSLNPPQMGGTVSGGIPDASPIVGELTPSAMPGPSVGGIPAPASQGSGPGVPASPGSSQGAAASPDASPTPSPTPTPLPPPDPVQPLASPPLAGEGTWQTLALLHGQPALRVTYLRPDSQHTSYLDTVVWIDQTLVTLTLHPGLQEPGGSGWSQAFDVPTSQRDTLLATFNSGYRLKDANGGYWADGQTAAPLREGAASVVYYKDGTVDIVKWGTSPPGPDVAAVRQNLVLLVDKGVVSPLVDNLTTPVWGTTWTTGFLLWRTGLGIRADGSLVFAIGPALTVGSLARMLQAAGAVRAIMLDQNPAWTDFMTYSHPKHGTAVPHMLVNDTVPNPYRYLYPSSRDFVVVQARS